MAKQKISNITVLKTSLDTVRLLKAQAIKFGFEIRNYDDLIRVVADVWVAAEKKGLLANLAGDKKKA